MTSPLTRMIAAVVLLLAWPLGVQGQKPSTVFRIGLLGTVPLSEPGAARIWGGLFEGLRELGDREPDNLVIEGRYSEGRSERLPALVTELVRLNVDVIVAAAYTPTVASAGTSTIPIVMANFGADPVHSGLVASLARPGGNVTRPGDNLTSTGSYSRKLLRVSPASRSSGIPARSPRAR